MEMVESLEVEEPTLWGVPGTVSSSGVVLSWGGGGGGGSGGGGIG